MGSGKSTVGKLLADKMNLEFIDLDEFMEALENCTIPSIFEDKGEIYFRKKEYAYLQEVLETKDNFVLSTGGGTPCYGENIQVITEATKNVYYLNVSIGGLIERLVKEKEDRPLIANIDNSQLPEFIGKHLFERSFFYSQAHHTVYCKDKSAEEVVIEISNSLV